MKKPSKAKVQAHLSLDKEAHVRTSKEYEKPVSYGVRTALNATAEYTRESSHKIFKALKEVGADYYLPDFTQAKPLKPVRSNLFEVPILRYNRATDKFYDDNNQKILYVKNSKGVLQVGKEMPATQPVITHEFLEDALYDLAEKHREEFEIIPSLTNDDRKGYRRYFGVLSKKLDTEIQKSFRKDDVVRLGALVHNGIAEDTAVGFDAFTYALRCENGMIGRGKDLGSASWAHQGSVEKLQEKILAGLEEMFDIGTEFLEYIKASNTIKMTKEHIQQIYQNTNISDRYYGVQYFSIDADKKPTDPERIQLAKNNATLWEGINAITQNVWHSQEIAFGRKSRQLRQLNNQIVQIVNTTR
jgi:Domain of unknown function (DUF932)